MCASRPVFLQDRIGKRRVSRPENDTGTLLSFSHCQCRILRQKRSGFQEEIPDCKRVDNLRHVWLHGYPVQTPGLEYYFSSVVGPVARYLVLPVDEVVFRNEDIPVNSVS